MDKIQYPFPVFIMKEGRWFVAECPILNIATQGRTEKEVKANMKDLIKEYHADPDTPKKQLKEISSPTLTFIPLAVPKKILYGEA
jgi:predicted RNase H-like HicB family nuclease